MVFARLVCVLVVSGVLAAPAYVRAAEAPATAAAPAKKRVLVMPFNAFGVEPAVAAPLTSLVDGEIGKYKEYDAVSTDDLNQMSKMQQQKQAGGCEADDQCLTEIGKKLHADLVVTGSVGVVGSAYVVTLTVGDPKGMSTARRVSETVRAKEEVPKAIGGLVSRLLGAHEAQAAFHLPKGKKTSFAVFDLKPTGLTPTIAQNLTQVLSTEVKGIEGASVISREDIAAMLQLDQAKQEAGTGDDKDMAAIGGALGVDRLITGDAGKVGDLYIVNLRLIDVRKGLVDNRVTETFSGDEEELLRAIRKAGRDLLGLTTTLPGKLTVTSNQTAADVFVDEKASGKAPALLAGIVPDRHAVRVVSAGYFDWHGDVYIDPLETTSVWAQLNARPQAWYQKWWVWTIAGAVVAGGATAAILATRPPPSTGVVAVGLP